MIRTKIATLLLLFPVLGISSESKQTISVSGNGTALVETDYVQMTFAIEVEDPSAKTAQEKNLQRAANVIQSLSKEFKISPKDIYTTDYTLQRQYLEEGKQRPYLASSGILLKLRNLKLYKDLLLEIQKLGVNQVSGIEFKSDSTAQQEKEALTAAYQDAKDKALVLANTLGKKEVNAVKIVESDSSVNPLVVYQMKGRPEESSPISVGERKIQAKVVVEFEVR
ncbi:DUF541 domain-containing protein [Leptospira gomenensis]|uniref:DUF541 domain-containing protein n=1 Tax=Leptospira gomenensis TaxID=2484974 RepID=A0A5F1YEN0_9LEPT|nr:SIMPL domain-containing protein [Leptospira gomenensis]TGK37596.1 DUF541 domain-containing protein [Leptospira gomenensis]TGK39395.1 DUF541 domain-containing protein [Leptospira gomenensis]TGK43181.1 DUF541 domain-containing protein [Leptospira gomenensis]TGK54990.1 DUF541 domain-containing protein [Leptospira gomenensis]